MCAGDQSSAGCFVDFKENVGKERRGTFAG
jgi:hypothetical protein